MPSFGRRHLVDIPGMCSPLRDLRGFLGSVLLSAQPRAHTPDELMTPLLVHAGRTQGPDFAALPIGRHPGQGRVVLGAACVPDDDVT